MTKREVTNKYFPQLIMIMSDPTNAINYCKPWSKGVLMGNLIDNMPDDKIPGLWNIIKTSKYKEAPKPILDALQDALKEATE